MKGRRLSNPSTPQERETDLRVVLAELHVIAHAVSALVPRVRIAIGAAVDECANVRMIDILNATSECFGVSQNDILSLRRTMNIVRPRQIAMYLCRKLTRRSYSEIGMFFGDRDHTTVLHAVHVVIRLADQDSNLTEKIRLLTDEILKEKPNDRNR